MADIITRFVPGEAYFTTAKTLLDYADTRIYLVMYQISLKGPALELVENMANVAHRVPDVQFILNYEGNNSLKNGVKDFLSQFKGGETIKVWITDDNTTHAKVLIVDNWLLLGSTNYSRRGMGENYEANIVTNDPKALAGALKWFEQLRTEASPVKV